jgi:hypothetical protein
VEATLIDTSDRIGWMELGKLPGKMDLLTAYHKFFLEFKITPPSRQSYVELYMNNDFLFSAIAILSFLPGLAKNSAALQTLLVMPAKTFLVNILFNFH